MANKSRTITFYKSITQTSIIFWSISRSTSCIEKFILFAVVYVFLRIDFLYPVIAEPVMDGCWEDEPKNLQVSFMKKELCHR